MANSPTPTVVLIVLALVVGLLCPAAAQQCNCQPGFCCSKYGYCGTTSAYCGPGCSVVTESFFNGIKSHAWRGCEGQSFYTRDAFLEAVDAYPRFANGGSELQSKREIAAFFAHFTHETGHMCYINEVAEGLYCDESGEGQPWPCVPGQRYFGRGALQLSWNYNYGPAGRSLGFDGLRDPDAVAQDPVLAFKTALWFWMENVHQVMAQGFGATIRAINGGDECQGGSGIGTNEMEARVRFYLNYCNQFGINPGSNLYC
ncbi:hypothetical protein U9M48_019860 [Paspalum notatum var. saurae]|uniref:chitinase n=1 Tax=Paspalum notatum var. saurae TaxID=547442 RepID=A0AAQ3WR33_PASNO